MKYTLLFIFGVFILFALSPAPALAAKGDDFSGRTYLQMDASVRTFYVNGFVHGMSIVRPMADEDAIVPWLSKCIEGMGPVQFEETLTGYIKKHPELQDARLDVLAFLAFKAKCRRK